MTVQYLSKRTWLSSLWVFILFNMIFRDLHQFVVPGYIQDMMKAQVSEVALLFFAFILELMIAMVILNHILPDTINKFANTIVAAICWLGLLVTLASPDLDDIFFSLMQSAGYIAILVISWRPNREL